MPVAKLGDVGIVAANAAAWVLVFLASGTLAARLSDGVLRRDWWLLRPRRFERDGRFYERRLRIRAWKDRVPEAGAFSGGVSKRHLPATEGRGIERFVLETRRAELAHWIPIACVPAFVVWNPPLGLLLNLAFAVAFNAPFIAIQRYNRLRSERILRRRALRPSRP